MFKTKKFWFIAAIIIAVITFVATKDNGEVVAPVVDVVVEINEAPAP